MNDRIDTIRQNLLKAIEKSEKSRLQLTKAAGISYPHISRFLSGNFKGEIGLGVLQNLASVLNVPLSYILGETDTDGHLIHSSSGVPLPEKWDELFKRIQTLPKDKEQKVYALIVSAIAVIEG